MKNGSFIIADWLVKPSNHLLINKDIEVHVEPKVMMLLQFMANAQGEVVNREVILEAVWQQIILDGALTNSIANLRRALGDTKSPRRYIETIPKRGYRLIPDVIWQSEAQSVEINQEHLSTIDYAKKRKTDHKLSNTAIFSPRKIGLAIVTLVILIMTLVLISSDNTKFDSDLENRLEEHNKLQTLAVLPFDVYSKQSDVGFFASGLTEELIHQFAADPNLRVIARSSSSVFQGANTPIKKISEVLGARYIIEGSVRQNEQILRITVQLIDASNGFHLWSKTFDKDINGDLLDTQTHIAEQVSLLITSQKPPTNNPNRRNHPKSAKAYKLFILAQSHMKTGQVNNYQKALAYYQQTVDIAPNYALAYSGMATAHLLLYQYAHTSLEQTRIDVSRLLTKALSIEPFLAEAFAAKGLLHTYLQEFAPAEKNYLKAIDLNPNLRIARHNFGFMLWRLSRSKEALVQFKYALSMDPLSAVTNFAVGDSLVNIGEIEKGMAHFSNCQELLPNDFSCYLAMSGIYNLTGDLEQQKAYLLKSKNIVADNNLYQTTSTAIFEFQQGQLEIANQLVTNASQQDSSYYSLLKADFNINLKTSTLDAFLQKLTDLSLQNPSNVDLNLLMGLTAYFRSNCQLAIAQYETARKEKGSSQLEIWDFADGTSHELNLAYCYQQRNNMTESRALLNHYDQLIRLLPKSDYEIPGKVYNQARYLALTRQSIEAKALLEKLKDWPYIWLADKDPILNNL